MTKNKTSPVQILLYGVGALALFCGTVVIGLWISQKKTERKFREIIRVVESAATPAEEKEAFIFAAESGVVWSTGYVSGDYLPERVQHLSGEKVYHVEWWASGVPKGKTTAYRVILDEANLKYLKRTE